MIRRPQTLPDGSSRYILISQVEHARISGQCAAAWGQGNFAPLSPADELIAAVTHHDDGWAVWEERPGVDPETGRPRDFMEMPVDEFLEVWRRSILSAERFGPLAGWTVSRHFSVLLERFSDRWQRHAEDRPRAESFLSEQAGKRQSWLAAWQASHPRVDAAATAARGLAMLQLFDGLSLWLCCRDRTTPQSLQPPDEPPVVFQPAGHEIRVSPWPFSKQEVLLSAPGRSIPATRYADSAALAAAPSEPITLNWRLRPA